jgi:hypothetical protein
LITFAEIYLLNRWGPAHKYSHQSLHSNDKDKKSVVELSKMSQNKPVWIVSFTKKNFLFSIYRPAEWEALIAPVPLNFELSVNNAKHAPV